MLGKLKAAYGFLGGLGPTVLKLTGILELLSQLIRVKLKDSKAEDVSQACDEWFEASAAIRIVLKEADEAFLAVKAAVDGAGDGGTSITYNEIKDALSEAKDVGPVIIDANRQLGDVLKVLKKLA